MSASGYPWLVYEWLPRAFFFDLLVLPLGLWWIRKWRRLRAASVR